MAKDIKEEVKVSVPSKLSLKYKAISYGDYVAKAQELLLKNDGVIQGMNRGATVAVCLLYQENKVIDKFVLGGETFFICEA